MNVAVIGCGAMGSATVYDLACEGNNVLLIDHDADRIRALLSWLADLKPKGRLEPVFLDVSNQHALTARLRGIDAAAIALPWSLTRLAISAALEVACPVASIARPNLDDLAALDRAAREQRAQVLLPCGLEPGLTEILARHAVLQIDNATGLHIRCGGIPVNPTPPLGYKILFGRSLPIALRDAYVVECRQLRKVPRFSGRESFYVEGVGEVEAFHDGMLPWFAEDPDIGNVDTVTQKTIRWPGFAEKILVLAELGLLSEEPVPVGDVKVAPRQVVDAVLYPKVSWAAGDEDLTILLVEAVGFKGGHSVRFQVTLVDRYDPQTRLTAMARTTGFTLAAVTRLLGRGRIEGVGWIQPQRVITGELLTALLDDLRHRGIHIEMFLLPEVSSSSAIIRTDRRC